MRLPNAYTFHPPDLTQSGTSPILVIPANNASSAIIPVSHVRRVEDFIGGMNVDENRLVLARSCLTVLLVAFSTPIHKLVDN